VKAKRAKHNFICVSYDTPTIVSVDETIARHGAPNNSGHPRMEYNMDLVNLVRKRSE